MRFLKKRITILALRNGAKGVLIDVDELVVHFADLEAKLVGCSAPHDGTGLNRTSLFEKHLGSLFCHVVFRLRPIAEAHVELELKILLALPQKNRRELIHGLVECKLSIEVEGEVLLKKQVDGAVPGIQRGIS